jgi:hypothetical protein
MTEALGLDATIIAVVGLCIKMGVQCSQYYERLQSARREVRRLLNEASRVGTTLKDVQNLLKAPNRTRIEASKNVRRRIVSSRLQLEDLSSELDIGRNDGCGSGHSRKQM